MAKKFTRNITGTILRGEQKEPLHTNLQNDLLSDSEDVFVRNKDEYHCLTDNVKEITSPNLIIKRIDKNTVEIVGTGDGGDGGDFIETSLIVKENSTEYMEVTSVATNQFEIGLTSDFISNFETILDTVNNLPNMSNYYTKEEVNTLLEGFITEQAQSDWAETDSTSPSFILNKPAIPDPVNLDGYATEDYVQDEIAKIPDPGETEQVQSDWNETVTTSPGYILNKPDIPDPADFEQEQVQSDWSETDDTLPSYIVNKPVIPDPVNLDGYATEDYVQEEIGKIPTPEAQVQSDWNIKTTSHPAYIKNKPTIPDPADFEPEPQVQSDWNETDDTSPGYILNKPTIPEPTDLTDYYNKEEVDGLIDGVSGGGGGEVDRKPRQYNGTEVRSTGDNIDLERYNDKSFVKYIVDSPYPSTDVSINYDSSTGVFMKNSKLVIYIESTDRFNSYPLTFPSHWKVLPSVPEAVPKRGEGFVMLEFYTLTDYEDRNTYIVRGVN